MESGGKFLKKGNLVTFRPKKIIIDYFVKEKMRIMAVVTELLPDSHSCMVEIIYPKEFEGIELGLGVDQVTWLADRRLDDNLIRQLFACQESLDALRDLCLQ